MGILEVASLVLGSIGTGAGVTALIRQWRGERQANIALALQAVDAEQIEVILTNRGPALAREVFIELRIINVKGVLSLSDFQPVSRLPIAVLDVGMPYRIRGHTRQRADDWQAFVEWIDGVGHHSKRVSIQVLESPPPKVARITAHFHADPGGHRKLIVLTNRGSAKAEQVDFNVADSEIEKTLRLIRDGLPLAQLAPENNASFVVILTGSTPPNIPLRVTWQDEKGSQEELITVPVLETPGSGVVW